MKKLAGIILGLSLGVSALSANQAENISYEEKVVLENKTEMIKQLNCSEKVGFSKNRIQLKKIQLVAVCKPTMQIRTREINQDSEAYIRASIEYDIQNAINAKEGEKNEKVN